MLKNQGVFRRGYWNHAYNYVDNNPLYLTDFSGLSTFEDLAKRLGKRSPRGLNTKGIGGVLGEACAEKLCFPGIGNITRTFADAECFSLMREIGMSDPFFAGVVENAAGAAAVLGACSQGCMDEVNSREFQKKCSGTACLIDKEDLGV